MHFVNYASLVRDLREWSSGLPDDIAALSGIPRSGAMVASILALHRNIVLDRAVPRRKEGHGWQATAGNGALLVDDSAYTGSTMSKYVQAHSFQGRTGAVYVTPQAKACVHYFYRVVPPPRVFEWNLFHCNHMHYACLDLDGVLCHDPSASDNDDGPRYLRFVNEAAPLFVPSSRVHSIVTNRLERYRKHTEQWLARNRISYAHLIMSPLATRRERMSSAAYAEPKARYYSAADAYLFVESDPSLARQIHELTGKDVICSRDMTIWTKTSQE